MQLTRKKFPNELTWLNNLERANYNEKESSS